MEYKDNLRKRKRRREKMMRDGAVVAMIEEKRWFRFRRTGDYLEHCRFWLHSKHALGEQKRTVESRLKRLLKNRWQLKYEIGTGCEPDE